MVTKTNERDTDRVIPSPNTPTTHEASRSVTRPDSNAIASRAYQIWKAEGCPEGRSDDHWLQAERELRGK
ncbi:MAG: DUF2934 domain-containing protein [Deltaproteobacteria bacterium]|nr:DUF2934 domain-containing protein [Deltaproteobacteria bacterium]